MCLDGDCASTKFLKSKRALISVPELSEQAGKFGPGSDVSLGLLVLGVKQERLWRDEELCGCWIAQRRGLIEGGLVTSETRGSYSHWKAAPSCSVGAAVCAVWRTAACMG